jgi:hypothetical protein
MGWAMEEEMECWWGRAMFGWWRLGTFWVEEVLSEIID